MGPASSGSLMPFQDPSRSWGQDAEGNKLLWRWGHTTNTLCALSWGFTQTPHFFFIVLDLDTPWNKGKKASKLEFSKAKVPFSLLLSSGLYLGHVLLPTSATFLKLDPGTGPSTSMTLPCQHLFYCWGLHLFPVYSCKCFNSPWREQQGWALGAAACKPHACFFHKVFAFEGQETSQALRYNLWAVLWKGKWPLLITDPTWAPADAVNVFSSWVFTCCKSNS